MPELPEVETVCVGLKKDIIGLTIQDVILSGKHLRIPLPKNFSKLVTGGVIKDISRLAKYILIHLNNDQTIIIHLGMSGRITINSNVEIAKHQHVIFCFDQQLRLVFQDPRRFGLVTLVNSDQLATNKLFQNLGPEPFAKNCSVAYLQAKLQNKKAPIKSIIMDNNVMVGVGNIYACESLFRTGISPIRAGYLLSKKEINFLLAEIIKVLQEAINAGGSSLRDYVNSSGELGYFQQQLLVYGREGKPCRKCNQNIIRIKQAGRSTFYCQHCQI